MTAREMWPAVGATVDVRCDLLWIRATVADVKHAYGRTRLLVKPAAGSGEQWVELERVRLVPVPKPANAPAITRLPGE